MQTEKKKKWIISIAFVGLLLSLVLYNVWDNHRVVADRVTLAHAELPEAFDGYKILQITDLHESVFGNEQEKLIGLIKSLEYDLVLFTGDYVSDDSGDLKPLEDLLKGMPDDQEMYYILGNADAEHSVAPLVPGNAFYDLFAKHGVQPLYPGKQIERNGESIWLTVSPYADINSIWQEIPQSLQKAKTEFDALYSAQTNPFTIEVSHRPTNIIMEDEDIQRYRQKLSHNQGDEWIRWDISINGHTHGGQFWLPVIGPVYSPNDGFFPGSTNVRGVHTANGHTQYVCPGLGASGPVFAQFRLFNTPCVGLITLKAEK